MRPGRSKIVERTVFTRKERCLLSHTVYLHSLHTLKGGADCIKDRQYCPAVKGRSLYRVCAG